MAMQQHVPHPSDFPKARLKRQVLNFGSLNPNVAIRRFTQPYKCHSSLIF
jgi:hypothetical protein